MKQTYIIQRMTNANYHEYMIGGYNYTIEKVLIEAETPAEAVKLAEKEGCVVNSEYVRTLAEIEAEEAARKAYIEAESAKRQAAKERKTAREAEKAEAMRLTVEQYKRYKREKAIAKKLPAEIEELKREIARKLAYLNELNARIEKVEKP